VVYLSDGTQLRFSRGQLPVAPTLDNTTANVVLCADAELAHQVAPVQSSRYRSAGKREGDQAGGRMQSNR